MKWFLKCPKKEILVEYKVCRDECKGTTCETYGEFVEERVKETTDEMRDLLTVTEVERIRRKL